MAEIMAKDAKSELAASLMALGLRSDEVCTQADISRSTLERYKTDSEFANKVVERSKEVFNQLLPVAIQRVSALLESKNEGIRLRAVKLVLDKTLPDLTQNDTRNLSAVHVKVSYE